MNYLSIAEAAKELGVDELEVIRKIRSGNLEAWVNFINEVPGRVVSPECAKYGSDIKVRGCWKLGMTGEPLSGGALTIIERAEVRLRHGIQMENPSDMLGYIFISQNKKICALLDSKKLKSPVWDANIFAGELPDDAILAVSEEEVAQLKALDTRREAPFEAAPLAPAMAGTASDEPLALTTSDIAFCFDGVRWSEKKWRKPLGDKPKWLQACVVTPGQKGVSQTRWNPVLIASWLVRNEHARANSIRAKFQTKPPLKPWLEAWKTYEADYLGT